MSLENSDYNLETMVTLLLAKDETEKAINLLLEYVENHDVLNTITIHSGSFHRLKKDMNLGLISWEKASIEKNRINFRILNVLKEINSEIDSPNINLLDELWDALPRTKKKVKLLVFLAIITAVIALFIIKFSDLCFTPFKNPFPNEIVVDSIKKWSSGRLHLAKYQIRGYLGELNDKEQWLELVLTNPIAFPKKYSTQFNNKKKIKATKIDLRNLKFLDDEIERRYILGLENNTFLKEKNIYNRLLKRVDKQLLVLYEKEEIILLNKKELYFLRNEIYARKGRKFISSLLKKFFNRKGYNMSNSSINFNLNSLSKVEITNAFYLKWYYQQHENGLYNRAVSINSKNLFSNLKKILAYQLNKKNIEIFEKSNITKSEIFEKYSDFIINIYQTNSERNFLKPISLFHKYDRRKIKKEVNKGISALLLNMIAKDSVKKLAFVLEPAEDSESFMGLNIGLNKFDINRIKSSPNFQLQLSKAVSEFIAEYLDKYAKLIPDTSYIIKKSFSVNRTNIQSPLECLEEDYGMIKNYPAMTPEVIIIRYSEPNSFDEIYDRFKNLTLPMKERDIMRVGNLNFSVYYLIDRNGSIFNVLENSIFMNHLAGLNYKSIVIENIGGEKNKKLTNEQLKANEYLISYLDKKYQIKWLTNEVNIDENIINQLRKNVGLPYAATASK